MTASTVAFPTPAVFPDDVEVAVVAFNSRDTLPRVLECLRAARAPDERITVYDLGSTEPVSSWLPNERPNVQIKRLAVNDGPNPGRNLAIRSAVRPFVLLVDADAYMKPDVPRRLRAALDPSAKVGMTVPVIVHSANPQTIQYAGGSIHFICEAINPWRNRTLAERGDDAHDIGTAPGVTFLLDAAVAKRVGLFDERYFMGKEDGDFCHRLVMAGYRLVEDPHALIEHGSKPRSTWLFPFQIRNRWHFMLKNYETRTLVLLLPALAIHEPLQLALLIVKGHFGAYVKAIRSLLPWLRTLGPERREIRARRVVHDRQLLHSAPLIVREDVVSGRLGGTFKRAYDAWLSAYWRVIRPLLS